MYPHVITTYSAGHSQAPIPWVFDKIPRTSRLYYIHAGEAYFLNGETSFRLLPGFIYLFPYNLDFKAYQNENDPLIHTHFDFEMLPPFIGNHFLELSVTDNTLLYYSFMTISKYLVVANRICWSLSDQKAGRPKPENEILNHMLENLIAVICAESGTTLVSDHVVLTALETIHREYRRDITVRELAAQAYMTPDNFIRHFKASIRTTPYAYLRDTRLRTAISLRKQGMTYEEAAENVGYHSSSSLIHALNR